MGDVGSRHGEAGLIHDVAEGLDVERFIAGRIGVGDVAGDRRLARFRPTGMARGKIEEVDRVHANFSAAHKWQSRQATLPEAGRTGGDCAEPLTGAGGFGTSRWRPELGVGKRLVKSAKVLLERADTAVEADA